MTHVEVEIFEIDSQHKYDTRPYLTSGISQWYIDRTYQEANVGECSYIVRYSAPNVIIRFNGHNIVGIVLTSNFSAVYYAMVIDSLIKETKRPQ